MPWIYHQTTGHLIHKEKLVATGYSGAPGHVNNPESEHLHDRGPIPRGRYKIGPIGMHKTSKGKEMRLAMPLKPLGHVAYGRTHLLIHGDNKKNDRSASEGCMIFSPKELRLRIHNSLDAILEVRR